MSADIVARCTRAGVTSWSNVARMMGVSIDSARTQFDPTYRLPKPAIQQPQEPDVDAMTDAEAYRSPHARTDGLKALLMALLGRHGRLSCEQLAVLSSSTPNSVRMRLSQIRAAGLVENDDARPERPRGGRGRSISTTWWLTAAGKVATLGRPGSIGQGASSSEVIAA